MVLYYIGLFLLLLTVVGLSGVDPLVTRLSNLLILAYGDIIFLTWLALRGLVNISVGRVMSGTNFNAEFNRDST